METIWQLEIGITLFLQSLGAWLAGPMKFFSFFGTEGFYILILPALYWCIDSMLGFRVGVMLILTGSVNSIFKVLIHGARPYWFDANVKSFSTETSFGMPSGHAQNSISVLGLIATSIKKKWLSWIIWVLVFMIGLSRIYLGVHFTTDVLLGWSIGIILLVGFIKFEKPVGKWLASRSLGGQLRLIVIIALVIILLSFLSVLSLGPNYSVPAEWVTNATANGGEAPNPLDINGAFTLSGIFLGLAGGFAYFRNKFNGFDAGGKIEHRILRYLIGLVGIMILYAGLGAIFPRSEDLIGYALRFFRYTLIGVWVSFLAPMIFIRLKIAQPLNSKSTEKEG
ncbi:MAG: phosphatase PAP2 family protein [Anaerolineaceae bacterium]|nr:phosphatase PAP2 family protein [Anaerolineaceae bacterium]